MVWGSWNGENLSSSSTCPLNHNNFIRKQDSNCSEVPPQASEELPYSFRKHWIKSGISGIVWNRQRWTWGGAQIGTKLRKWIDHLSATQWVPRVSCWLSLWGCYHWSLRVFWSRRGKAGNVLLQAHLQIGGGGALQPFPGLMDGWEGGVWHCIDTVEDRWLFDQRACLGWWNWRDSFWSD